MNRGGSRGEGTVRGGKDNDVGVEDRLKDLEKIFIMKAKICKHSYRVRTLGQGLNGPEIWS